MSFHSPLKEQSIKHIQKFKKKDGKIIQDIDIIEEIDDGKKMIKIKRHATPNDLPFRKKSASLRKIIGAKSKKRHRKTVKNVNKK